MVRNYKKEYKNYQGSSKQKKRRASRNTARNRAIKVGSVRRGDSKDVHHRDGNPKNNSKKNLAFKSRKSNRSFPRTKNARKRRIV